MRPFVSFCGRAVSCKALSPVVKPSTSVLACGHGYLGAVGGLATLHALRSYSVRKTKLKSKIVSYPKRRDTKQRTRSRCDAESCRHPSRKAVSATSSRAAATPVQTASRESGQTASDGRSTPEETTNTNSNNSSSENDKSNRSSPTSGPPFFEAPHLYLQAYYRARIDLIFDECERAAAVLLSDWALAPTAVLFVEPPARHTYEETTEVLGEIVRYHSRLGRFVLKNRARQAAATAKKVPTDGATQPAGTATDHSRISTATDAKESTGKEATARPPPDAAGSGPSPRRFALLVQNHRDFFSSAKRVTIVCLPPPHTTRLIQETAAKHEAMLRQHKEELGEQNDDEDPDSEALATLQRTLQQLKGAPSSDANAVSDEPITLFSANAEKIAGKFTSFNHPFVVPDAEPAE